MKSWSKPKMNRIQQFLIVLSLGAIAGCATPPQASPEVTKSPLAKDAPTAPTPLPSDELAAPSPSAEPVEPFTTPSDVAPVAEPSPDPNTTTAMLYKVDQQCLKLQPEAAQVAASKPMESAVGEVIQLQANGDFKLSGYRVNVNNGVATIDLRLSPDSPRKITSLSTCEQFALFGSLRETLTKNSEWGVRSVQFTERGERIAL
jgi:hypothetical protein